MKYLGILLILVSFQNTLTSKVKYQCSGVLNNRTGSFRSPELPNKIKTGYPNDAECKWNITLPKDGEVNITFTLFDTEACCDYVKLTNEKGDLIHQYSGRKKPFSVIVKYDKARRVDITFKSDASMSKPGFKAFYVIHGKIDTVPSKVSNKTKVGVGIGPSLMEAFLKMAGALARIMNAVLGSPKIHHTKNIVTFKSELYQGLKSIETLKTVNSAALTKDESTQLNLVLKHLHEKAKATIIKLEPRLSPAVCSLPKVVGPCRGMFRRYFYDSKKNKCRRFDYGGCQGNGNNFEKMQDCKKLCIPKRKSLCPPGQPVFRCFANPCQVSSCPAYIVTSNCKANYCGGCNAVYFDQHNIEIPSHRCNCQPDQSAVECLVDPCRNATCAAQPDAKCRARRCDSCVAEFVALNGTIITKC